MLFLASVIAVRSEITVTLNETNTCQTMEGFGAAITESTAWLIQNRMTETQRTNLLHELFSTDSGIGLSYLRVPIGASDFRLADYTLDDMPAGQTDYTLAHFSTARDQLWVIPLLRAIRTVNTNISLMASPWSPPAWMKSSTNLYYGRLNTGAQQAFAGYLLKFIQAYAATGLPIASITLQNEPLYEPYAYPGMYMSAQQQINLAVTVGQLFQSNAIATRILCYDHNWDDYAYPNTVLSNAAARQYLAGTAFHGYEGAESAQSYVHNAHPDKEIYFTEITAGTWSGNFSDRLMWDVTHLLIGTTRHWAKTIIKWNLALDASGGPKTNGGCSGCQGILTINTNNGAVTRQHDYYILAHVSAFVRPGAVRIDSADNASDGPLTVAFQNTNGTMALITQNKSTSAQDFVIRWKNQLINYAMPAKSLATFSWPDSNGATVNVWITRGDQSMLFQRQTNSPVFQPQTLTVTLLPSAAIASGALWRVNNGAWRNSGQSVPLSVGIHTVECSTVARWIEPSPLDISLSSNQARSVALTYSNWPPAAQSFYFHAVALTNSVVLSWHDPRLSWFTNQTVLIRFSTSDYPAYTTDGSGLYTGALRTITHEPLTSLQTYYYTIWCSQNGSTFTNPP